jgi:hypothetical protein
MNEMFRQKIWQYQTMIAIEMEEIFGTTVVFSMCNMLYLLMNTIHGEEKSL